MNDQILVFHLPGHERLAEQLARTLDGAAGQLLVRQFPDGETYVRGDTRCDGADVVLAANLFQPDAQLLPLLYGVQALRDRGARRVILVSPYLSYMRQDTRFQLGEVVTSRIFAQLLSESVDGLVTVDPHLHRYRHLSDIYSIPTHVGHAAPAIASWIRESVKQPVIVGPDSESEQWVSEVADLAGAPFLVLSKTRHGDRDVRVSVPVMDQWRGHMPVLVDDIISTARTMIETVGHLTSAEYVAPICVGVHAIFASDAYESLKQAGAGEVVTCNTIEHPTNAIDLTDTLVAGVKRLLDTPAEQIIAMESQA